MKSTAELMRQTEQIMGMRESVRLLFVGPSERATRVVYTPEQDQLAFYHALVNQNGNDIEEFRSRLKAKGSAPLVGS